MSEALRKTHAIESKRKGRLALAFTAACGVAITSGILASLIYLLLALASMVLVRPAFAQSAPAEASVRLQSGIEKEEADGDLKSAMEIYEKVAADKSASRDVRAKALLRLGGCEEKLGRQAIRVYEQILRDFPDQPAAAQARKRLAFLQQQDHPTPPTTMSVRKVEWTDIGLFGPGDTDGKRAVFQDSKGNIFCGDLAGHSKHLVFKAESTELTGWQTSKDLSEVALEWSARPSRPARLAVVRTDGTGYRELVQDANGDILGNAAVVGEADFLVSWSWDNRSLLILSHEKNGDGRLVLVSVADGNHRELLHTEKGWLEKARFSPDGRFAAYEIAPPLETMGGTSHIFVLPIQEGDPHQVYESAARPADTRSGAIPWTFHDWTADGHYLILGDLNVGKPGLYLLPVKDGMATGAALFLRDGEFDAGEAAPSGAFIYSDQSTQTLESSPYLTPLGANDRPGGWRRLDFRGGMPRGGNPWPSFSADGRQIVYVAGDDDTDRRDLVLQDLSTGNNRVLYRATSRRLLCQASKKSPRVFCTIKGDDAAKTDLISVANDSGRVEKLATFDDPIHVYRSSEDDQTIYLSRSRSAIADGPIVRWNLTTHDETVLIGPREAVGSPEQWPTLDGRYILRDSLDSLSSRPSAGGEWKDIVKGDDWQRGDTTNSPDGKWILYHSIDSTGKHSLFRVSILGGSPERLGDIPTHSFRGSFHMSPDGRQLLLMSFDFDQSAMWVLEHFEPPAKK